MNYILLTILCIPSLFGSEIQPIGLGNYRPYMSDMPPYSGSSHALSLQPELDNSVFHNWDVSMSLGSTLVPEHAHIYADRPELFKEADTLFFAGEAQKLLELGESYSSWLSSFSFSARENRMVAKHIEKLLENRLFPHFVALKHAQPQEVRPILREVFATTNDPLVLAEAMILADTVQSGIICDYGAEFSIEPTHNEALDMMVTTRFGTHAIDKILPERGTSLNLGEAHDFGRTLMPTIDKFPESVRESLIRYAVEGFIERSMNPGTAMSQYYYVVSEIGTGIYDEVIGFYLKGPEYAQLRKQEIQQFNADLDKKLSSYTSKDYARLTGAAIADACMVKAIVHIGVYAYKHLVAPVVCPQTRMTLEKLLSESTVKRVTPPQRSHAGVRELSNPKTYEQFLKDLKEISVTPIRELKKPDGLRSFGKDISGKTLLVRPVCNNAKIPNETPTFEIQPINRLIEKTIKIRGEI